MSYEDEPIFYPVLSPVMIPNLDSEGLLELASSRPTSVITYGDTHVYSLPAQYY